MFRFRLDGSSGVPPYLQLVHQVRQSLLPSRRPRRTPATRCGRRWRPFMRDVMAACADGGLTVVIASHVISELERLCDWLLVLTGGRLQLAGAVEDLVSVHHLLTMPLPTPDAELPGTVISRVDSDRHSTVLVAAGSADLAASLRPGWQSEPVSFEQLVLAYLRCPAATASAEPRAGISGIPAQDRRTVAQ